MTSARFALTGHVCRTCLGRVLERTGEFVCSGCEQQTGGAVSDLCGCGMCSTAGRALPAIVRGAFHCGDNPALGPASPLKIVILYSGIPVAGLG